MDSLTDGVVKKDVMSFSCYSIMAVTSVRVFNPLCVTYLRMSVVAEEVKSSSGESALLLQYRTFLLNVSASMIGEEISPVLTVNFIRGCLSLKI